MVYGILYRGKTDQQCVVVAAAVPADLQLLPTVHRQVCNYSLSITNFSGAT